MKLWATTTENKCFVKMLWHLLDECVKVTILLVYSICIVHRFFFFHSSICALFSIYKRKKKYKRKTKKKKCSYCRYSASWICSYCSKKKKKDKVAHQNDTVDEQYKNTEWTFLKYCSGIAAFHKTFIFSCS